MKIKARQFVSVLLLAAMLVEILSLNIFAAVLTDADRPATRAATSVAAADPVEIVLDYAKAVEIPKSYIHNSIECASGTSVVGMLGIVSSGTHGTIANSVSDVYCQTNGDTYTANYGTFTRISAGLSYQPTRFIDSIETVYVIYKLNVSGTAKYLYIELRLVPGTSVYYETDFSDTAFETMSTDGDHYFDNDNAFYADFTNTELDQKRYEKSVYGGKNFDLEENWNALPTDPDTLIDAYVRPWLENGTLRVDFAGYSTSRNFIWAQANGDLQGGFCLNFHPHETYVVQARVKFHDLVADGTPYMKLYYFTGIDRWEGIAEDWGNRYKEKRYTFQQTYGFTDEQIAALSTNEYITITFPLGKTQLDTHTLLTNLRFQFGNVNSVSADVLGGFTLDYIYVGPEHSAPENQALYFDFGGTVEDMNHYGTHNYLNRNFDLASAWSSTTAARIESVAVDEENSALVYTSKYNTDQPNFTIYNPQKLHYTPANAEVFQIRFKLKNYVSGSTQNWLKLSYWACGGSSWVADVATKQFPASYLNSDEFVTIQMELPDSFRDVNDLETLRLQVTGLKSVSETELGTMTIDYIYIGPKTKAPTEIEKNDYLLFDFTNSEAARTRYINNPAYGVFNYDIGNWATAANGNASSYTIDNAKGTVSVAVTDRDSDHGPYFATTNTAGTYPWGSTGKGNAPISYPITPDTVLKIRFKVSGCTVAGSSNPRVRMLSHYTDSSGNPQYTNDLFAREYVYKEGEYQILTFTLSEYFSGTETLNSVGFRFSQIDGTGENASVTIDYIYVGPSEIIPTDDEAASNLYFDFGNTSVDQARYEDNPAYGGKNYDLSSNWSTYTKYYTAPTVDTASGTLRFGFADNSRKYLWCQTNYDPQYDYSLSYRPGSDHYIYMRLRFNDMVASGASTVKILYYIGKDIFEGKTDKTERPYELDAYSITAEQISSGEFVTFKIPIARTDGTVHTRWTNIRLLFSNIASVSAEKFGTIDIDYLYFGPSSPISTAEPSANYLYFDFRNSEVDQERYAEDPAYGGKNYDLPSSWAYNSGYSLTPVMDYIAGTMTIGYTKTNYTGMWYHLNPSSADNYKMAYYPASDHCIKIRLRFNDMVASSAKPYVRFFYCTMEDIYEGKDRVNENQRYYWLDKIYITAEDVESEGFVTLSLPIGSMYNPDHRKWSTLRLNVDGVTGVDADHLGTIDIDYIYFGSETNFEKAQTEYRRNWQTVTDGTTPDNKQGNDIQSLGKALLFDFGDTPTDRVRYNGAQYGSTSFDVSTAWGTERSFRVNSFAVNSNDGTLDLALKNSQTSFTFCTSSALSYDLSNFEVLELRFKMSNMVQQSNKTPYVSVAYKGDNSSDWKDACTVNSFPAEYLSNGEYVTLRMLRENFAGDFLTANTLTSFDFYFANLNTGTSGTLSIDYIYLGPKTTAPSSKSTYGFDPSYENDSKLSNGSSLYVDGRGIPLMRSNKSLNYDCAFSETAFTFTGTGFDIIARTGADQGQLRAAIYDARGNFVKVVQVLTKSDLGTELMQIPVLSVEMRDANTQELQHGTYYVKLLIAAAYDYGNDGNSDTYDGALDRGGEFCFDAIRIHNPINTAAGTADAATANRLYRKHGEADATVTEVRQMLIDAGNFNAGGSMNGVVYLDALIKDDAEFDNENGRLPLAVAEYKGAGPNNEVYLKPGNAIAFKLEASGVLPESVDVGAKSADGNAVSMSVSIGTSAPGSIATGTVRTIASSSAMYYPLEIFTPTWKADSSKADTYYLYITVYNNGTSGILSITDIKCAYDDSDTAAAATAAYDVSPSSLGTKSVRFLVDEEMLKALGMGDEPVVDEKLSFGAQLYLENDLTMTFRVKEALLSAYDISTAYLVVERDVYATGAAEAVRETVTVSEYVIEEERLIFSYPGIAAAQMNDAIRATLYIKDASGKEYASPVLETSVTSYLDGLLATSATDSKLVTLIMDMLNYGTAAQVYFDRHADAPANAAFESFKTYAGFASADFTAALENLAATEGTEGKWGKLNLGLDLSTRIGVQYKVTLPEGVFAEDATLVITDGNGNELETIEIASGIVDREGRYVVTFRGASTCDMRRVIYATAYAGGEAITGTYAYSISTYAWDIRENAAAMDAELVDVARAMILYGDSASAYFA